MRPPPHSGLRASGRRSSFTGEPEDVAKYGYEYFLKKMEEAKAKAEGYAT